MKDYLNAASGDQRAREPVWVAAVALVNERGQVLVQKRHATGAHADLWEFPGGKLEPGESPEAAAVRELSEELAVAIAVADLHPVSFACGTVDQTAGARPLVILLFACERWQGSPEPLCAAALTWCDVRDLPDRAMPPLDYPLAAALELWLRKGD